MNMERKLLLKKVMARYLTESATITEKEVIQNINDYSHILCDKSDLTPLFKKIGDARIVMLGEADANSKDQKLIRLVYDSSLKKFYS
jgi:hypothetical protein